MNKKLYVFNIAVRRDDGKIEQDTIYRDKLFTQDEVKEMSEKNNCSVIVSCVGIFRQATDKFVLDNTFSYVLPKPVEVQSNGN